MRISSLLFHGVTAALLLAGIGAASATSATYRCSDGTSFTARFSSPGYATGQAELTFGNGGSLTLPQAVAADGGRYAVGNVEFWIKGKNATLKRGGTTQACSSL